jgi:hypothetical protein
MPDPLPPDLAGALRDSLTRRGRLGATVHYFTEIGSTNDVAARLADSGAPDGTLVVASGDIGTRRPMQGSTPRSSPAA